MRIGYFDTPWNTTASPSFSSRFSSSRPAPRDSISLWNVCSRSMASSTVLPSTRSTITDRLACEMEQPWPSHTNRLMVCGSSSETSTWMVASSPQVGLNWCDSPGVVHLFEVIPAHTEFVHGVLFYSTPKNLRMPLAASTNAWASSTEL